MSKISVLLLKLKSVTPSGNGWSACCPAHNDRKPSLSVSKGSDGRVLVKCHAGCELPDILSAIGMTAADLAPANPGPTPKKKSKAKPSGRTFSTYDAAVEALERKLGPRSGLWTYHDASGDPVGVVVRWDRADGKDFRPVARYSDGWRIGAMPEPRPLYRLPELANAKSVVVLEGEKAVEAARCLGFTATTSAGVAQAASKTDWGPLAGVEVWLMPDNDPPGRQYENAVVAMLAKLTPPPVVKVLVLPGLPEGGDLVDWIATHSDAAEPEGMRAEIEALAAKTKPVAESKKVPEPNREIRFVPDLICLADVEPVEVPWLWPGRIPIGRITLLVGRPGAGKSFLTCDIASRLSTGVDWPDGGAAPLGDTLLLSAEDDPSDTIVPRLNASAANCRRVHVLRAAKLIEASGDEKCVAFDLANIDLLREALNQIPDCRMIVVDPAGSYLGGNVDAYRDNEVRAVLAPLAALARERNIAVLLVCHTRKAVATFADDTALGSRAFVGIARSVLHLSSETQDRSRKLLLPGKCNLSDGAPGLAFRIGGEPPSLQWEPEPLDGMHADDALASEPSEGHRRGPEPKARDAAVSWLTELLRDGPKLVEEIEKESKAAGLSWSTIRRAKDKLDITPRKQSFAGKWLWELSKTQLGPDDREESRTRPSSEKPGHLGTTAGSSSTKFPEASEDDQANSNVDSFASLRQDDLFPNPPDGLPD